MQVAQRRVRRRRVRRPLQPVPSLDATAGRQADDTDLRRGVHADELDHQAARDTVQHRSVSAEAQRATHAKVRDDWYVLKLDELGLQGGEPVLELGDSLRASGSLAGRDRGEIPQAQPQLEELGVLGTPPPQHRPQAGRTVPGILDTGVDPQQVAAISLMRASEFVGHPAQVGFEVGNFGLVLVLAADPLIDVAAHHDDRAKRYEDQALRHMRDGQHGRSHDQRCHQRQEGEPLLLLGLRCCRQLDLARHHSWQDGGRPGEGDVVGGGRLHAGSADLDDAEVGVSDGDDVVGTDPDAAHALAAHEDAVRGILVDDFDGFPDQDASVLLRYELVAQHDIIAWRPAHR